MISNTPTRVVSGLQFSPNWHPFVGFSRGCAGALLAGLLGSCAPSAESKTPLSESTPAPAPVASQSEPVASRSVVASSFSSSASAGFMIRAQGLVVELPDADGWKKLPARGRWSGLRHEQSDSELWLRLVEARRTVTLSECRKEARASLSLLHGSGEPDHDRALTSPAEYGGRLGVTLNPDGGGQVEVYGVTVSRCFAALFITGSAAGFPERLQRATNDIFNSFRVPTIGERGQVRRF